MAEFFGNIFSFIGTCVNFVGTGFLDIIVVVVAALIAGVGGAGLCSIINDMTLRGKPDYDQTGTPAVMVGFVLGAVIGAIICICLLCTSTTLGQTVHGMLGVYGIVIALIVLLLFINSRLKRRWAAQASAKRRS